MLPAAFFYLILKSMSLIKADKVSYEYIRRDKDGAVEGINKAVD